MQIERHRGLPGGRAVVGGALVALAVLGIFVAYDRAGAGPSDTVVMATSGIGAGEVVEAEDLKLVEVDLDDELTEVFSSIESVEGRVALGPIGEDELVQSGSLTDQQGGEAAHEVALELPRGQVAVGRLKEGERVDVYVSTDQATHSVARGAQVVDIDVADGSTLTGDREIALVVAVPTEEAVAAVVHALQTGEVTVVRSTLAEASSSDPVTFDPSTSEPAGVDSG